MAQTSKDRNTPMMDGKLLRLPMAAGVTIPAGTIVMVSNGDGMAYGVANSSMVAVGRAEESKQNSGAAGSEFVLVRRGKAFKWDNSPNDPITATALCRPCYVQDNQTVRLGSLNGQLPLAGTIIQIDPDGVWVQM
ncbi:hypothetical protein EAY64_06075 [Aquitalea palustris]|uniref:DUF2190 family protein n=1 Tax=Aquitalea palustris TaxID=2480983 RepID=A0A454JKN1_9NEIS|nr:hypothetical protein [Aquitalea palustris]RMC99874.1 hypothetical protein EAY64_06075 [Aquitalea palustris]